MPIRVVLDATVLANARVRDVALAFAEDGLYQPYWSDGIIAEADHRLPEHLARPTRDYLFAELDRAFPDARVNATGERLAKGDFACAPCVIDPRETHVTSVALLCHADAVVTADAVTARALERSGVEAWTRDAFVTFALDADPARAQRSLLRMVRRRWLEPGTEANPSDADLLVRLAVWARSALGDNSADLLRGYAAAT